MKNLLLLVLLVVLIGLLHLEIYRNPFYKPLKRLEKVSAGFCFYLHASTRNPAWTIDHNERPRGGGGRRGGRDNPSQTVNVYHRGGRAQTIKRHRHT